MAKALHKRQASAWARSKVKQGITYLKEGKYTEAFQMFNTALQTHPESVDAYVARGALWVQSQFVFASNNTHLVHSIDSLLFVK